MAATPSTLLLEETCCCGKASLGGGTCRCSRVNAELVTCDEAEISCGGCEDVNDTTGEYTGDLTGDAVVSKFVDANTGMACVLVELPNTSLPCFSESLVKADKSDVVGCLDISPRLLVKSEVLEEVVAVVVCCNRVPFGFWRASPAKNELGAPEGAPENKRAVSMSADPANNNDGSESKFVKRDVSCFCCTAILEELW